MGLYIGNTRYCLIEQIPQGGGGLPQGAVEIAYLQGNNDTFIDTGIKASSNIEFELGVSILSSIPQSSSSYINVFGGRIAYLNSALTVQYYNQSTQFWRWSYANANSHVNSAAKGFYFLTNMGKKNTLVTTGAGITNVSCTNATFNSNYNIFIFAMNTAGTKTINYNTYLQVQFCRLYESGILVRDFIPIRIGQTGYMYDKVSRETFANKGTDSFILGPDIT